MSATQRSRVDVVLAYHERSKHRPGAYARALDYVDADTQPSAFRIYDGAPNVLLDEIPVAETSREAAETGAVLGPAYDELFLPGSIAPAKLAFENLSQFLYDSLALSVWKQDGRARTGLRVNHSSGNLYPVEAYLVLPAIRDVGPKPAVYHYSPLLHALEVRRDLSPDDWEELAIPLPTDAFLIGLSSVVWRQAWKFGERAFRYVEHDIGHAIASIALAAASLGWGVRRVAGLRDDELAMFFGIHSQRGPEAELPELLLAVAPAFAEPRAPSEGTTSTPFMLSNLPTEMWTRARRADWRGLPNALSARHQDWPILDVVANATRREEAEVTIPPPPPSSSVLEEKEKTFDDELPLAFTRTIRGKGFSLKVGTMWQPTFELIRVANDELQAPWRKASADVRPAFARVVSRRRRTASSMNTRTRIPKDLFTRMLARTMPTHGHPVFDALGRLSFLHMILFVHRVRDVPTGMYLLARDFGQIGTLREAITKPFVWKPVETREKLPLYLLERGDMRALVRTASCHQGLASDAAFAACMLGQLEPRLRADGTNAYRTLHWEAGAIAQVLYLEAEAAGLRGAAMGAFFDDNIHDALGLRGRTLQALYHFAVGGTTDDPRQVYLPPYAHREQLFDA